MTSSVQKSRRRLQRLLKCYPPFLGAGIKVKRISEDLRTIEVHMPLRFWNRNYVVWDKADTNRFKKRGKGLVKATFNISEERVNEIRAQADDQDKTEPQF